MGGKKFWFVDQEKAAPAGSMRNMRAAEKSFFAGTTTREVRVSSLPGDPDRTSSGSNRRARLPATLGFRISVAHEHTRSTSTGSVGAV